MKGIPFEIINSTREYCLWRVNSERKCLGSIEIDSNFLKSASEVFIEIVVFVFTFAAAIMILVFVDATIVTGIA